MCGRCWRRRGLRRGTRRRGRRHGRSLAGTGHAGRRRAAPPAPSALSRWLPAAFRGDDLAPAWKPRRLLAGALRRSSAQRGGDSDPDVMFAAANAAYRLARRSGERRHRSGGASRSGARGLRSGPQGRSPGDGDAAWNFEFVSRHATCWPRPPAPRGRPAPETPGVAIRRSALTVHGVPGAPPPEVKTEQFETIAPMDFGDREAQPEATPGTHQAQRVSPQ